MRYLSHKYETCVEAGVELDSRILLQLVGPAQRQVAEARRLALEADGLLKGDRFVDCRLRCRRTGADLLELADISVVPLRRRLQRPGRGDAILAHVEQTRAERRQQPLVQADTVIVHFQIAQLEGKVSERVRAVDNRDDAALARHPAEIPNRKQLARLVGDVAEVEDFRLRRDGALEPLQEIRLRGRAREVEPRRARWSHVVSMRP